MSWYGPNHEHVVRFLISLRTLRQADLSRSMVFALSTTPRIGEQADTAVMAIHGALSRNESLRNASDEAVADARLILQQLEWTSGRNLDYEVLYAVRAIVVLDVVDFQKLVVLFKPFRFTSVDVPVNWGPQNERMFYLSIQDEALRLSALRDHLKNVLASRAAERWIGEVLFSGGGPAGLQVTESDVRATVPRAVFRADSEDETRAVFTLDFEGSAGLVDQLRSVAEEAVPPYRHVYLKEVDPVACVLREMTWEAGRASPVREVEWEGQ